MEVEVTKLEGCRRVLDITVPSEEPDKAYKDLMDDFRKTLQVPGFRRGKVPASVIEKRFGRELVQEVIEKIVPKALNEAIEQESLRPVEQPTREDVSYDVGSPLKIKASFEIMPDLELNKYIDLKLTVEVKDLKLADKDVDAQLQQLRERSATFEPVVLERSVVEDDFVIADIRGESEREEAVPFRREGVAVHVTKEGKDAGFSAKFIGMTKGGKKEFKLSYPEDFEDPALADQTFNYQVEVTEIRKRILPDLDDEFAKDLGQFTSIKELRDEVERQLKDENERAKRNRTEEKLIEVLVEENPEFELPQVMVQRQLASRENELRRHMLGRNINPDHIGFDWTAFRKEVRPKAEQDVRRILLLDAIADKENISVAAKEIRVEIDAIAASIGEDPKELRQQMLRDGRYEYIGSSLRDRKTLDWLIEKNTIKERS